MTDEQMPLSRRERNKYETRKRLLSAARALFAERGVTGTTIDDLAEAANVSRATFFNYFPTKDAVVSALHDGHMQKLGILIDGLLEREMTTHERIRLVFEDITDATHRFREYLRAGELERDPARDQISPERTEQFHDLIRRLLDRGITDGDVRTDYSARFLAQTVAAVYISSVQYSRPLSPQDTDSPDTDSQDTDSFDDAMRFIAEALEPRDSIA